MMRAVIVAKGEASAGEGARIAIREGLFMAFAELYGGRAYNGTVSQALFVDCPDGDAAVGKQALSRCDMWSVNGRSGPERMASRLVAAAKEYPEGMGLNVLLHALDRLECRYDVIEMGFAETGEAPEEGEQDIDAPRVKRRRTS